MHRSFRLALLAAMGLPILTAAIHNPSLWAQDAGGRFRKLAPGVETTIPTDIQEEETVSTHNVMEIKAIEALKWSPNYTPESRTLYRMADDVKFRRTITGLEFTFKPLRMIHVDVPQPSGKFQRKLIWYMVYRVKNVGGHLQPVRNEDGTYTTQPVNTEVPFIPGFVLYSHEFKKSYLDRLIPVAVGPIQAREDPNRPLLNSVEISQQLIPQSSDQVDRSVWGVVTWEDVDPRIDFFSIYIQGLTNAYKWIDPPGAYKPGDPPGKGRYFGRKTLQLNFWRPGDEYLEHENEIRYGTPLGKAAIYGVPEGVDHIWLYR